MPTATPRAERRWNAAVEEHRTALAGYFDAASRVPDEAWMRPYAPGKWTPAVITEHLAMSYRHLVQEVRGGPGMKLKLNAFWRRVNRTLLLPHMLFHRTFPRGAHAPREVRPHGQGLPKEQALTELRLLAEEFEREVQRARAGGLKHVSHAYFGDIDLTRGMRLCAVHVEHHARQLASVR